MSTMTAAQVTTSVRTEVNDLGTDRSQTIRREQPAGEMDGVNTRFTIVRWPIPVGTFKLYKSGALLVVTTDYAIDLTTGLLTMVVAPNFSAGDRLEADYQFIWFPDEQYLEFVISAGGMLGKTSTATTVADRVDAVILATEEGLMEALKLFAACRYYMSRGGEYTHQFNANAGGQTQFSESISRNFRDSAKQTCDRATLARDDFYKGFGGREKPAAAIRNFSGIRRYQPRR